MNTLTKCFCIASSVLLLASCSNDDYYQKYQIRTGSLVSPIASDEKPYAVQTDYMVDFNLSKSKATITTDNLVIGKSAVTAGAQINGVTVASTFSGDAFAFQCEGAPASKAGTSNAMKDLNGICRPDLYGIPGAIAGFDMALIMNYSLNGQYNVATFPLDAVYRGTTSTTAAENHGSDPYTSTDIAYRVVMDLSKNKAAVYFYEAKFAEAMPMAVNFVLQDLDVEWSDGAYRISGSNLVPLVSQNGQLVDFPSYTFDRFELNTINKRMTQVTITYTVASRYNASFSGSYVG